MHEGQFVLTQRMRHLPMYTFRRLIAKYDGDHYVKCFTCPDQFLCMVFTQPSGRESLRDIEICLRAHQAKLCHLGIRGRLARSTLADANEQRDWRIYAEFAQRRIAAARRPYVNDLPATTISALCRHRWQMVRTVADRQACVH